MPTVENAELGRKIDCLALEKGLRTLARNPNIRLSINMSARSIGFPRWVRALERGLKQNPTIGERLILEISESSAMLVPELVINFMKGLQSKGISFALDDFGAGYTAFRHFRDFYFDIVKIDGQFIRGIADFPDNQVLVAALAAIAEQFDMLTVAEHVERPEDAAMLTEMGIDCMQGFYFGAPSVRPPWKKHSRGDMSAQAIA
jgi:EAL domain-containing protein (putative c-di-GMP-specific phosphodiesterase class I)